MKFSRSSGILLHPTSLPGRFGIGDLGEQAYRFADFLVSSGQTLWQVLPLGPTGYGDSPYACYSAFAGNTLLISLERLAADGLLSAGDLAAAPTFTATRVDFGQVHTVKDQLLSLAFERFQSANNPGLKNEYETFCWSHSDWLDDYALFRALREKHGGRLWREWETRLARHEREALMVASEVLRVEVEAHKFCQFIFFKQWSELKSYCNREGLKLVGDIPIFVAEDSADVWSHPGQFKLDNELRPTVVAGVPPDYFSKTGQFWGNPIYDWAQMEADGFGWWIERVKATLQLFDIVRIDHFRGFAACWEIPAGDKTAERGRWVEVPGRKLFQAVKNALGDLPIIAEDLGVITPDVDELRDDLGFPGMRVLQFAFGSDARSQDLPHNYQQNVVAYTGTHDNDTTVGWFESKAGPDSTRDEAQIKHEREFCLKYLGSDGQEIHWDLIRAAFASVANTAIVPLQDVLGLGNEARMNLPNSTGGNWDWRFADGDLTEEISRRLRELTEIYGRLNVR
jgi:4-alpha-glucanotransferase